MGSNSIPGRPMRAHTAIPTLILMLSAAGQPLAAQDTERGSGLWIAGGLGGGWTRVHCDICDDDLLFGLAANLGIGSRLSSSLALGIEGSGWRKRVETTETTTKRRLLTLQAVAYWYPARNGPRYFFKGGLGVVSYSLDDDPGPDEEDEDPITSSSLGGQVGVGYEIPVSSHLSFSPYVNLMGSLGADLKRGSTVFTSASITAIQFGLGLAWH